MQINKSQTIDLLLEGKSVFIDGKEIRYNKSNSMIQCRSENRGHKWINSPFWLSNLLACKTCEVFEVNHPKDSKYPEVHHVSLKRRMGMRINKYRGRRNYDKKWIYGSLLIDRNGDFHILESNIIEKDGHHIRIDSDYPMFFENDTIGQFTGLHDKNGVEIYENDKVFDGKYHGIIEYRECSFVINWEIDCSHDDDLNYWNDKIEVIGNIHERSD